MRIKLTDPSVTNDEIAKALECGHDASAKIHTTGCFYLNWSPEYAPYTLGVRASQEILVVHHPVFFGTDFGKRALKLGTEID